MARIRTIKPEFFTSADIVSLSPLARLFYIALWCEADRNGRLKWDPKTLKLRYLPGDDCDLQAIAGELMDAELVVVYEVEGKRYAEIPTFSHHQIINNREREGEIPARDHASKQPNHASGTRAQDDEDAQKRHASHIPFDASGTRESGVKAEGKGKEGKGYSEAKASGGEPPTSAEVVFALGLPMLTNAGTAERQARSFLGMLRKRAGDDATADAVQRCAAEAPTQPLEWLAAALLPAGGGKRGAHKPADGVAGMFDNPHPQWAIDAGFRTRFDAENEGCYERNAAQFREGKRIEVRA